MAGRIEDGVDECAHGPPRGFKHYEHLSDYPLTDYIIYNLFPNSVITVGPDGAQTLGRTADQDLSIASVQQVRGHGFQTYPPVATATGDETLALVIGDRASNQFHNGPH